MEIEYKFYIPSDKTVQQITQAEFWGRYEHSTWETERMQAIYYLDPQGILAGRGISLRVRTEGARPVLTVKAPGSKEGTYSVRQEWNVPWLDDALTISAVLDELPDLSGEVKEALELVRDEDLDSSLRTDVFRTQSHFSFTETTALVSMDEGWLYAGSQSEPCFELEIEFISGDTQVLENFALKVQEEFSLQGNTSNKLKRLIALRQKVD